MRLERSSDNVATVMVCLELWINDDRHMERDFWSRPSWKWLQGFSQP